MKLKNLILISSAMLVALLPAARADAAPITIDFTSAAYNGANGLTSYVVVDQGITVGLSTTAGSTLSKTADGLGVNGPTILDDPNEIGWMEVLNGTLAPSVTLYSINV